MALAIYEFEPHFAVTDTATDIRGSLADGHYLCANRSDSTPVLWARRSSAPTDDADYFAARPATFFRFDAGPDSLPTWVKTPTGATSNAAVARARET